MRAGLGACKFTPAQPKAYVNIYVFNVVLAPLRGVGA
jgi:hypothetical protein